MEENRTAIIFISTDFLSGLSRIKNVLREMSEIGELQRISTIYKKYRSQRSEDLNAVIVTAARWKLNMSEAEVFDLIEDIAASVTGGNTEIFFLAATDTVRLVPGENLPHPLLHSDSLVLRCAAEVFGEYRHPILAQTLSELVFCSDPVIDVEFFDQGKGLVAELFSHSNENSKQDGGLS